MKEKRFTKDDLGCYADGANGAGHRQRVLAAFLGNLTGISARALALLADYVDYTDPTSCAQPEDLYEWEDEAVDCLNEFTDDGLRFEIIGERRRGADLVLAEYKPSE